MRSVSAPVSVLVVRSLPNSVMLDVLEASLTEPEMVISST